MKMCRMFLLIAIQITLWYQLINTSEVRQFRPRDLNYRINKKQENESLPDHIWKNVKKGANTTWIVLESGAKGFWKGIEDAFKKPETKPPQREINTTPDNFFKRIINKMLKVFGQSTQ